LSTSTYEALHTHNPQPTTHDVLAWKRATNRQTDRLRVAGMGTSIRTLGNPYPHHCRTFTYEIIIVDDGSKDDTYNVAMGYVKKYGDDIVRVCKLSPNCGKGGAVRKVGSVIRRGQAVVSSPKPRPPAPRQHWFSPCHLPRPPRLPCVQSGHAACPRRVPAHGGR
jgi:hypothetical protein